MPVNLNDWLGLNLWAWWLCALVLVLTAALLARRLVVLAAAVGPALAAVIAVLRPDRFGLHVLIGVSASVLAVIWAVWSRHPDDGSPSSRSAA